MLGVHGTAAYYWASEWLPLGLRSRLSSDETMIFGAFGPELVGSVGLYRETHLKTAHKVFVWGMYVKATHRGQQLGRRLVETAISHARTLKNVNQIQLSVSEAAPEARRLYESLGFVVWGSEPLALCHQGQYVTEHHLTLQLRKNND